MQAERFGCGHALDVVVVLPTSGILMPVQGLCQARPTHGGMGQGVQDRAGGAREGRRGRGLSGASLLWCQGPDASGQAACQHGGTSGDA